MDVSRENGNLSPAASSQPQLFFSLFIAAVVASGSSAQPEAHVPSRRPAAASFDAVHPHGIVSDTYSADAAQPGTSLRHAAFASIRARIQNDKHDVEDILPVSPSFSNKALILIIYLMMHTNLRASNDPIKPPSLSNRLAFSLLNDADVRRAIVGYKLRSFG